MTPSAREPVPVTVLTGFLGAGKTTLLNAWLRNPATGRLAVVINEFGEVGIDDALVAEASGDMLSLVTGCVCCASRGDLVDAVAALLARRAAMAAAVSRIVVETTGLADPGPVLNALLLAPDLAGRVRAEGVVAVVSAAEGDAVLDRHDEARRQVALADRLVLSHLDRPEGAARVAALTRRLVRLAPAAAIMDAADAARDGRLLLGAPAIVPASIAERPHRHHAAKGGIRAIVLEAGLVDARRLAAFVDLAAARCGAGLLRLKGLAAIAGDAERPTVVQAVGPVLHPATRLAAWPDGGPRTRLVAVLDDIDPAAVSTLWSDLFGPPAIDRPDAAALAPGTADAPGLF